MFLIHGALIVLVTGAIISAAAKAAAAGVVAAATAYAAVTAYLCWTGPVPPGGLESPLEQPAAQSDAAQGSTPEQHATGLPMWPRRTSISMSLLTDHGAGHLCSRSQLGHW